jgi:hypothetical protein
MVFEVGDNGDPISNNGQKFEFKYSASSGGIAKTPLTIDYNEITALANITATTFKKAGATAGNILLADGSDITKISLPVSILMQTSLDLKAGLITNNSFSGTNTFSKLTSIDTGGLSNGINIGNNGSVTGLNISSTDNGKGIVINNTTAATAIPLSIRKDSVDKLTILDSGKIVSSTSLQVGDDTSTAISTNVGSLRYRVSGNSSYIDMVMQTGASTFEWVNIIQNAW